VCKVVQPLQSVNYHDSHAHSPERHGPFTQLVGYVGLVLFGLSLDGLVHGMQQVQRLCMVLGLATGGMPMSVGRFCLQV
jgi:hypothetical protein